MLKLNKFFSLVAFFLSAVAAISQTDLISVKDFTAQKDIVIIDANKAKNYNVNHVKGAINVDPSDFFVDGKTSGTLKSPAELAAYFGSKGINQNSKVIIYDDGTQKYSTRVYLVLKYLGAADVKLMHKDANEFRNNKVVLTASPASLTPTTFASTLNDNMLVNYDYVKSNKDRQGVVLVDVRTPEEFNGTTNGEVGIPGAININHETLLTESGAFKSPEQMKAITDKFNITPETEVIVYCRTGIRASVGFTAFKNILGFNNVKLYDGSLLEWISRTQSN